MHTIRYAHVLRKSMSSSSAQCGPTDTRVAPLRRRMHPSEVAARALHPSALGRRWHMTRPMTGKDGMIDE